MVPAALLLAVALEAPTPYDLALAETLLHEPPGTPTEVDDSVRLRVAVLTVMYRLEALDGDINHRWFAAGLQFWNEMDHARRVVLDLRTCPPTSLGRLIPSMAECVEVVKFNKAVAARLRAEAEQASEHRAWELERDAIECEWVATRWATICNAGHYGYQRPFRVRLRDSQHLLGPHGELPPRFVPRLFIER